MQNHFPEKTIAYSFFLHIFAILLTPYFTLLSMRTILLFLTTIILGLVSCQKEDVSPQEPITPPETPYKTIILDAFMEELSTQNETNNLHTLWNEGDAIGVHTIRNNASRFLKFDLYQGAGTTNGKFRGELSEDENLSTVAIYPYQENLSINETVLSFRLPERQNYTQFLHAPMIAYINEKESILNFKHLCGFLQFTLENLPSTVTTFKLITSNNITGNCMVNIQDEGLSLQMAHNASNSITVDLTSPPPSSTYQILIPVPAGEYTSMTIILTDIAGRELKNISTTETYVVKQASVLSIPPISCEINIPEEETTHYRVINGVTFQNTDLEISKLVSILPVPVSNEYQIIENLSVSDGTIYNITGTENRYVRSIIHGIPAKGDSYTLSETFDVYLRTVKFNFEQIERIYPYDENSEAYKQFLGQRGEYVDPSNPDIMKIGKEIWNSSTDILDYARKCYEYVASHYKYLNAYTGIHPLKKILQDGGGDCGNLTSIYVSLLRYKNIPSKHIVTVRPDGSYHVWNDFYLEKYGWIPVDVTAKNSDPNGDYFGYCAGDGIIMSKDLDFLIEIDENNTMEVVLLQNYFYWYWYLSGNGIINSNHFIRIL